MNYWLSGPEWLCVHPVQWPVSELKCLSAHNKTVVQATSITTAPNSSVEPIVPFERFSKLADLLQLTSLVFKYVNKLRHLEVDNAMCARTHLFRVMQHQSYSREIDYLRDPANKEIPELVQRLNLFLDTAGILRTKGRIEKATSLEYEITHPTLLAKGHSLTLLIIKDCHEKCSHLGIASTLNKLRRSGFWVPRGRQAVKTALSDCYLCKRFNALAFKYPKVTNLPKHRVNLIKPFLHTGVDFTGHLWIEGDKGVCKMYLLVFTCLTIRAIHLELVPDMSTRSFLLALMRFTNMYGIPSHIYSDNARSFIAGCNMMEEVFTSTEFKTEYQSYNIKHIRIPQYSAWVGSTWERLIRVVKSCLFKAIGRSRIPYFELLTVISDVQNSINQRPLTYRCSSESELEAITPNCFLRPNVNAGLLLKVENPDLCETEPPSRTEVVESINIRDELLTKFRELWYQEYLLSLREQCRDLHEIDFTNKVEVDEIVLIKHPNKTRPFWQLGRVTELVPGDDGKVRSVKIKRGDGSVGLHSVKLLYPLELSLTHNYRSRPHPEGNEEDENTIIPPTTNNTETEDSLPTVNQRPRRSTSQRRKNPSPDDPYIYY